MADALGAARRVGELTARLAIVGAITVMLVGLASQAHAGAVPPNFNIEKFVNGVDADTAPGVVVPVGSTVTFTYLVTLQSAGGNQVTVDPINDDNGTSGFTGDDFSPAFVAGDVIPNNRLDVGEIWLYVQTGTASLGLVTNVASVTVRDAFGGSATDSDPANYTGVAVVTSPMALLLLVSGMIPVAAARVRRARPTA